MDLQVVFDSTLYKVIQNGNVIFVSPLELEVLNFVEWKIKSDRDSKSGCASC